MISKLLLPLLLLPVSLCLVGLSAPNTAFAGGFGAHGGEVVYCPNQKSMFLDYYDAVTYQTLGGEKLDLVDVDQMTSDEVLALFRTRLQGFAFLEQFNQVLALFGPVNDWEARPNLNTVYDANEPYALGTGCSKVTLTAREGTHLIVDPTVRAQITDGQFGVMIAHEAFFFFGENEAGLQTSEKIRALIRELLKKRFDPDAAILAFRDLGGSKNFFEELEHGGVEKKFYAPCPDRIRCSTGISLGAGPGPTQVTLGLNVSTVGVMPSETEVLLYCDPTGKVCTGNSAPPQATYYCVTFEAGGAEVTLESRPSPMVTWVGSTYYDQSFTQSLSWLLPPTP